MNCKVATTSWNNFILNAQPDIDISADQWRIISAIVKTHLPDKTVWAFGSRVKHTSKPYSDLDLIIIGDDAIPLNVLASLGNAFADSDLPFKVDLLDWATVSQEFRTVIENDHVVLNF